MEIYLVFSVDVCGCSWLSFFKPMITIISTLFNAKKKQIPNRYSRNRHDPQRLSPNVAVVKTTHPMLPSQGQNLQAECSSLKSAWINSRLATWHGSQNCCSLDLSSYSWNMFIFYDLALAMYEVHVKPPISSTLGPSPQGQLEWAAKSPVGRR